jgi:protein ImuB
MNRRVACVLIPDFPLEVQLRSQPELVEKPVALAEGSNDRSIVLNTNLHAANEGVETGMTIVQAKNVCPKLNVLTKDARKERRRFDELTRKLQNFSPFIEEAKPGIAYLDTSGFTRTYPEEKDLAKKLISFVKTLGYPVKIGIAGNKFTSLVGAWISGICSYTIVLPGEEKSFLETQPIQLLPIDQDQYEKLYRLGIRTLGQFALLPDQEVVARFGSESVTLLKMTRGEDDELIQPKRLDEKENKAQDFESPLETQIGILFYVNSILERQLSQLAQKGWGCEKVLVILKTGDNNEVPINLSLAKETNKPKLLIDLLALELKNVILPDPVKEIQVSIQTTSPLSSEQTSLYRKKEANPLGQILTRLKRVLGNGNILSPRVISSNKPEGRLQLISYSPPQKGDSREISGRKKRGEKSVPEPTETQVGFSENSISGFRLYDPPKPATVREQNGLIGFVIADFWYGEVQRQKGPWEISGEWWSERYDRNYFEIELSDGARYLLFLDNSTHRWFLQGIFD